MSSVSENIGQLSSAERLERNPLSELYAKFRVHYYREVFQRINARELSLTTTEVYCVEIIHSLGKPTIQEFANYIYKIFKEESIYKFILLLVDELLESKLRLVDYKLNLIEKYNVVSFTKLNKEGINEFIEEYTTYIAEFDLFKLEFSNVERYQLLNDYSKSVKDYYSNNNKNK